MTRRLLLLVCAVLCLSSSVRIQAQSVSSSTATSADGNYVEGVVRVKLQREIADRLVATKLPLSVKGTGKKYVQTHNGCLNIIDNNIPLQPKSITK